jgi:hypothetical protein
LVLVGRGSIGFVTDVARLQIVRCELPSSSDKWYHAISCKKTTH